MHKLTCGHCKKEIDVEIKRKKGRCPVCGVLLRLYRKRNGKPKKTTPLKY